MKQKVGLYRTNELNKIIYTSRHNEFEEFTISILDNKIDVSVPMPKSEVLYKTTLYSKEKVIEYLEKHICFSRKKAKYDYESALEFNEFSEMIDNSNNLLIFKSTNKSTFQETKYLFLSCTEPGEMKLLIIHVMK